MTPFTQVLPRTAKLFKQDHDAGQHHGFQLYVSLNGEPIADIGQGLAAPDRPMAIDTRVSWLSAGKPLTVAAFAKLWEAGELQLDDLLASRLPEITSDWRNTTTFRHVLTHMAGLQDVDPGYPGKAWNETLQYVLESPVGKDSVIGRTGAYHTSSSWFLLGEAIARTANTSFDELIRTSVLHPLGMDATQFSMTEQEYITQDDQIGWMWRRQGKSLAPLDWHTSPRIHRSSPGSSARGPIRQLGLLYENLLASLTGEDGLLSAQTAEALTSPHRVGIIDQTFQARVDFGLGFLVNTSHGPDDRMPYGFGRHASRRAFGHGGSQSTIGFADPECGLVVAWATNALIGEPRHQTRNHEINTAIYEDLGLV